MIRSLSLQVKAIGTRVGKRALTAVAKQGHLVGFGGYFLSCHIAVAGAAMSTLGLPLLRALEHALK